MENVEPFPQKERKSNYWKILTVVLGVLLIASVVTDGFRQFSFSSGITGQAVADKSVGFINQNLLQGQAAASVKTVETEGDLYKIKLLINGKDFDTYVTKDGKKLFVQSFDLEQAPVSAAANTPAPAAVKNDKPEVLLFTMSYCPYGNQAEDAMIPVIPLLDKKAVIEPHYVIYSNYGGGGPNFCLDAENKYCSMHGIQELNENVRELCVYRYQKEKFWDFIKAVNTQCNYQNVDACWEGVAKAAGINTEKIKSCQKTEALDLLKKEVELNEKYNVQGSPMLIINGEDFNGPRTPEGYKSGICAAFNTAPEECSTSLGAAAAAAPAGGCAV